jgi:tRNA threonylcarbamoyladenosine biosynthesis protein TsaB
VIVLGIDGGLGGFSAAIARDGEPLATVALPGNVALEQGLAAVGMVLRQAAMSPRSLDRLAVGIGPGSFTGVRIAISYAKSLAQGWKLPLTGVSSFDAIEAGVAVQESTARLIVVRGRPGVVSVRLEKGERVLRASGYIADVVHELAQEICSENLAVLGDAEDVLAALGERASNVQIVSRVIEPAALAIATIAMQREPAHSLHEVRADYGELPAAKIPRIRGAHGEH